MIGAFQYLDTERASAADTLPIGGSFHGVPFVIKDIINTDDMPAGWGSELYRDRQTDRNAAPQGSFGEHGEEALDLIDSRGAGWCEVNVPARTLGGPVADRLGLVGGDVVHNDMDVETLRHTALDLVGTFAKLTRPMASWWSSARRFPCCIRISSIWSQFSQSPPGTWKNSGARPGRCFRAGLNLHSAVAGTLWGDVPIGAGGARMPVAVNKSPPFGYRAAFSRRK